jgi:acetylornithine deacetylase
VKQEQPSLSNSTNIGQLPSDALSLLKDIISIPSFSREEDNVATLIASFLSGKDVPVNRSFNNIWATNRHFDSNKPTILLNSHHDTVKPNSGYTIDPFSPVVVDGKLFGLGSNDAGGALVSLIATFLFFYDKEDLKYNLVLAATAEEEISGHNGIEALLPLLPRIDAAIVGEPTLMQMAIAERGLVVLDCTAEGVAGHAARKEGVNAINRAIEDINWFREYRFPRVSPLLGPVQMTVTSINTPNKAHNIIPSECSYVVDVRVNELYSLEEILETVHSSVQSMVTPRSIRLRSTNISEKHPLVQAGQALGLATYGSPTTSDKALMPFPSLKIGPGDSARSHAADEFIHISEVEEGISIYLRLLNSILL